MTQAKEKLRQKYKQIRLLAASRTVEEASLFICRELFEQVDWATIRRVCSYDPMGKLKEVDVRPLLESLGYEYPDIKIKLLKQSKKQAIPKLNFDLILVPCLAFDTDNYRLGWGGGFYDKFLAGQPRALKIGLCFEAGYVKTSLPIEPHDVKLDLIITEERTRRK